MPKAANLTERCERRARVTALRLEGKTLHEIAELVGISTYTVHHDLRAIEQQWIDQATLSYVEKVHEKEGDYLRVRNTALDAYFVSCTKDNPAGDPRWLEIARRCDESIVKLYKLDDVEAFARNDAASGAVQDGQRVEVIEVIVESREQVAALLDFDQFKKMAMESMESNSPSSVEPPTTAAG